MASQVPSQLMAMELEHDPLLMPPAASAGVGKALPQVGKEEGQEPATRKRRWRDELVDKVMGIEGEVKGLQQLATSHSLAPYLTDLFHQYESISAEMKTRLGELTHLEGFLVRAHILPLPSSLPLFPARAHAKPFIDYSTEKFEFQMDGGKDWLRCDDYGYDGNG